MEKFVEIPTNSKSIFMRKAVYGVGLNDSNYQVQPIIESKQIRCPYYEVWRGMLQRCYDPKYQKKQPTYVGCTVCDSWLVFSSFKSWMEQQNWVGNQLDKDLLILGNKHYSPDTCMFVPSEVNSLLTDRRAKRGKYLLGVCFDSKNNKYVAQCSKKGKRIKIGRFLSELEAHQAYIVCKKQVIYEIANEQIKEALIKIASEY